MKIFSIIIVVLVCLYLIDKICLWLERKGYLYYRHKKANVGAMGTAMMELQVFLNPSARYVVEQKQNNISYECRKSDAEKDITPVNE